MLATHGRGIWIIDDISPLRSLSPQVMAKEAVFLPTEQAVQYVSAFGGWAEGDNSFHGPGRPEDAAITYYQRSRHIFGDLKIEVFDDQGKLVDTIASSKHRGVNRATWSMHMKPPRVPPAASALFQAAQGPRVLPGVYTVKMTKGDNVYTAKLNVVMDPRAAYTLADRKEQLVRSRSRSGFSQPFATSIPFWSLFREAPIPHTSRGQRIRCWASALLPLRLSRRAFRDTTASRLRLCPVVGSAPSWWRGCRRASSGRRRRFS